MEVLILDMHTFMTSKNSTMEYAVAARNTKIQPVNKPDPVVLNAVARSCKEYKNTNQ